MGAPTPEERNPSLAASAFIHNFEAEFGPLRPPFIEASYREVLTAQPQVGSVGSKQQPARQRHALLSLLSGRAESEERVQVLGGVLAFGYAQQHKRLLQVRISWRAGRQGRRGEHD